MEKENIGIKRAKFCWSCTAKAGFGVAIASLVWGRNNPYIPLLAVILSAAALIKRKKEADLGQRSILVVLASIGLTLGLIVIFMFFYQG